MKLTDLTTEKLTAIFEGNPEMFRGVHDYWYEDLIEDFTEQLESIGFKDADINFSGFWSQGDGACFFGEYHLELAKACKMTPVSYSFHKKLIESEVEFASLHRLGRYAHEDSVYFDFDNEGDYCGKSFIEACKEFMGYIYFTLEEEYDYLTSVEHFLEEVANGQYDHMDIMQTPEDEIYLVRISRTHLL